MITLKTLTLKNFLSVGAVTQSVDFNNQNLTLILGENLDLGGDGAKNGTGKTSILQGLSYALFGVAINSIKKDNLINRTNSKGMVVTVDFSVDDVEYRIERGRKPTFLKFYINNQQQNEDEASDAQGDSRETQDAIDRVLSMSSDMFQHVLGLNTYNTPFLSLKANDQRIIIEQLLGITILSEKADVIRALNKQTKEDIQREDFRIKGVEEANVRIQEQIDSLVRRKNLWVLKHKEDLTKLLDEYTDLSKVDIDRELQNHKLLEMYVKRRDQIVARERIVAMQISWKQNRDSEITKLESTLDELNTIDIASEITRWRDLKLYHELVAIRTQQDRELTRLERELKTEHTTSTKLTAEIAELEGNRCYACGQDFHDENHAAVLANKQTLLKNTQSKIEELQNQIVTIKKENSWELPSAPVTHYKTEKEAILHNSKVERVREQITNKFSETDPYAEQLDAMPVEELGVQPITHYDTEEQAVRHSSRMSSVADQIKIKHCEVDPYTEQIAEMRQVAIQVISFDKINELSKIMQHQEYLLALLTDKKSFVRRKIIEQNLSYLNSRLTHYLDNLGLPHRVEFMNDLSVEITEHGRESEFDSLSRGERTRVILGLSLAFRDVFESLYTSCNVLFIDELIDNGLDTIGVENAIGLLKHISRARNKSVFLVSHRDELVSRVETILKVVKENGFTSYENNYAP
jgi:DNA repair exonuclease SbcCD ATPase subunit